MDDRLNYSLLTRRAAVYLGTHCNIGSKRAFPTGVLDRWHNCLLNYWRNVAQRVTPKSVRLLLRHDSAKRRRQQSPKFVFFRALTVRPWPKLTHERYIRGMSTSPRNDSHCRKLCRLGYTSITNTPREYPFSVVFGPVNTWAETRKFFNGLRMRTPIHVFISKMLIIGAV